MHKLAVLWLIVLCMAGCGRSVSVEPLPITSERIDTACSALVAQLPETLSAGRAWEVQPDPDSTMAWGSPSVVLRCGDQVPQPEPTEQLVTVDGLDWRIVPLTAGDRFTTVARSPGVEVTVPDDYAPTASVLAELSSVVQTGTS